MIDNTKVLRIDPDDPNWFGKASGFEAAYYLDFQIASALNCLQRFQNSNIGNEWRNKYEYYHFYSDHLLFSMGQIATRFLESNKDSPKIKTRKKINCQKFCFSKSDYPILSEKRVRNVIEHIDERNQKIILEKKAVGGFCLIDDETDFKLANTILNQKETQPYILDLVNNEILVRCNTEDLVVDLEALKNELIALRNSVNSFMESLYCTKDDLCDWYN